MAASRGPNDAVRILPLYSCLSSVLLWLLASLAASHSWHIWRNCWKLQAYMFILRGQKEKKFSLFTLSLLLSLPSPCLSLLHGRLWMALLSHVYNTQTKSSKSQAWVLWPPLSPRERQVLGLADPCTMRQEGSSQWKVSCQANVHNR